MSVRSENDAPKEGAERDVKVRAKRMEEKGDGEMEERWRWWFGKLLRAAGEGGIRSQHQQLSTRGSQ